MGDQSWRLSASWLFPFWRCGGVGGASRPCHQVPTRVSRLLLSASLHARLHVGVYGGALQQLLPCVYVAWGGRGMLCRCWLTGLLADFGCYTQNSEAQSRIAQCLSACPDENRRQLAAGVRLAVHTQVGGMTRAASVVWGLAWDGVGLGPWLCQQSSPCARRLLPARAPRRRCGALPARCTTRILAAWTCGCGTTFFRAWTHTIFTLRRWRKWRTPYPFPPPPSPTSPLPQRA